MATVSGGNLSVGPELGRHSPSLRLSECLCPICMSILIEPVTMPCNHELCMPCFKQNVEEANFTCPMCRLRISNWARRAARENRLVNKGRWEEILAAFPVQCRKRLEGEDDEDDYVDEEDLVPKPAVAKPGEIREEYEKELQKIREQRHEEAQKEAQSSEEYIRQLQQEEVKRIEEERKEQERLRQQDEELARKLAGDLSKQNKLQKQAQDDERLAWKLHCEEQMIQSPRPVSIVSNTSSSSARNRKLSNSSRNSSSSSVKCMRIDTFLTPTAKSKSTSPSSDVAVDKYDINMPGTSKDIVVLTPSPQSNLSFESACSNSRPGPSGIAQLETSNSSSFLFDRGKTESNQSFSSSNDSNLNPNEKPGISTFPRLPSLDDFAEPKEQEPSMEAQRTRSFSAPFKPRTRSSSAQSHVSTMSAPAVPSSSAETESKENVSQERGRSQKKGAFHKYSSASTEKDKQIDRERSDSLSSVDSISHELSHFRPIQSSPRTARKKLADGSSQSPPIVQATPRNLKDMKTPVGTESPFLDPPPLVRAKLEQLNEERNMLVEATSKGTMTSKKVQHWKKIARPEARKNNTIGASTKRKLSKFEFSSDDDGFMQPAKLPRINPSSTNSSRGKRTVGTQKAIPVKKRQVQIDSDKEKCAVGDDSQSLTIPFDKSSKEFELDDFKSASWTRTVPKSTGHSGAKRKILMDDFARCKKPATKSIVDCDNDIAKAADQDEISGQSSLESEQSSSSSVNSPSKVYKMKLSVSKQGKARSKVTPVKTYPKRSSTKTNDTPVKQKRSTPSLINIRNETLDCSGDAKMAPNESDLNLSPENHVKGITSHRLRNGTSPGKGILVETIQNGSKKDDDAVIVTAKTKELCSVKDDVVKTKSPLPNRSTLSRTKSESPNVKRSPRSRKKQTASPKVTVASHASKSHPSQPPPLKNLKGKNNNSGAIMKSPRTQQRNTLWKYMELLSDEEKRLKQEEEDRRIALELQKEFDKQERTNRNKVIRAKGSKDAYGLRHSSTSSVP